MLTYNIFRWAKFQIIKQAKVSKNITRLIRLRDTTVQTCNPQAEDSFTAVQQ